MLSKIQLYFGIAGAFVLALVVAWFKGHSAASATHQAKQAVKERRDVKAVSAARAEASAASDETLDREVDKWTRK